ncbi:DUF4190 domain-containing protein [Marmoricola sp. URHB0036]|uniref:DUF4190 domain-containing protein n=1 Tax=Marmoricola sp. URHB0036 TaxID=1298863 RepID=UPI00040B676C|nr:DUF4190 domain-containing protein [Marmoricola sp. URHB0036]
MSRSYASSSNPEEPPAGNDPARRVTNGKATSSLVLGIAAVFLGLFCCGIGIVMGVPAIVLGRVARAEIAASAGLQGGMRLATSGVVLGILSCAMSIVLIVLTVTGVIDAPRKH